MKELSKNLFIVEIIVIIISFFFSLGICIWNGHLDLAAQLMCSLVGAVTIICVFAGIIAHFINPISDIIDNP